MPWVPELFSVPTLERIEEKWQRELVAVPYFDGLITGELDALVESFADEPVLHHPVRGRIRGERAFRAYASEMNAWLNQRSVVVEDVDQASHGSRGFDEVVLHVGGEAGPVHIPSAIVADKRSDGRIEELRIYFSSWPLTARHLNRPPVLQPDPALRASDVVADYQRALAAGDLDAIVATFEPEGYAREPAGDPFVHQGAGALRAFYELMFSDGAGIPLEHCTLIDDGRACGLEYNVVRWGQTELSPQAGVGVYVRGQSGKLAAARIYDDVSPPVQPPAGGSAGG